MEGLAPSSTAAHEGGLAVGDENLVRGGYRPILEGPGSRIGPYKLLQKIGEGGMGAVYMAEQETPVRRRVALKIIKPGMDTSQVIARFEAERQALALMDHQHIAKVLDAGATDTGRPYFVMELVRGVPITAYCDKNQLTPKERLELFVPVCNAIQHAHQKGIIHRDIKPSNVLVMIYDGKPVAKIIDFGLAKATDQRLTERTMFTQFGQVVGTLEYMSPEQAEMGSLDIDSRTDIYSLGVVLYELLTGSTPLGRAKIREAAYVELLRRICDDETPKPSARLSDSKDTLAAISAQRKTEPAKLARLVRGELDWIVMRALEKDRVRRYDTASAFARDIQRYLDGDPVEAGPPSTIYRLRKFARKYPAGLGIAAAFAALLVGATAVSLWQAYRATRAERVAQKDRKVALDAQTTAQAQSELALEAEKTAQAERNRAVESEKVAKELTERAIKAERTLRGEMELDEAVRHIKDATVFIIARIGNKPYAAGSGFAIEVRGDTVLIVTSRLVAEAKSTLLPRSVMGEGKLTLEVVFRSGSGPPEEQALPARILALDVTQEYATDLLAFLVAKGVSKPPAPMNMMANVEATEGMRYIGAGFFLGPQGIPETKENPRVAITTGIVGHIRTDEYGQITTLQAGEWFHLGLFGSPLVEQKTGKLLGVAVTSDYAGTSPRVGTIVPANAVRRALAGRVAAIEVDVRGVTPTGAALELRAHVVDPLRVVQGVVLNVAPASAPSISPGPDGFWPALPRCTSVELTSEANSNTVSGRVQVLLEGEGAAARNILIQPAYRDVFGTLIYARPKEFELPDKPGFILPPGDFRRAIGAGLDKSLASLGALVDPDGGCELTKDGGFKCITIEIPFGLRTLSPDISTGSDKKEPLHNAPIALTEIEGDFLACAEVKGVIQPEGTLPEDVRGNTILSTLQSAGLVLYQDRKNFVRFERVGGVILDGFQPVHRIEIDVVKNGVRVNPAVSLDVPNSDAVLTVVRRKRRLRCMLSRNGGISTVAFHELEADRPDRIKVGLTASNVSDRQFTAEFHNFALMNDADLIGRVFGDSGK
jgi:serine/threonine protein kinase